MNGRKQVSIFLFFILVGCNSEPERLPSIGEAFVGPITLQIRQDLTPKAPAVGALKHGERVEIVQTRRRFVRVRNAKVIEGWTDARHLLTTQQMNELEITAKRYQKAPSQGAATVYVALNVHTTPNRGSPSFYQIPEGGRVDVLAHELAPRVAFQPPSLLTPKPPPAPKPKKKKEEREEKVSPPPMPAAPRVPDNWIDLSKTVEDESPDDELPVQVEQKVEEKKPPPRPHVVPHDDWSLVRTPNGKVGWVLSRQLNLAIPDEVAQYAEGHRITSYFSLGEVQDGDQVKHNWVWTTIDGGLKPYEFDGFRVFTYVKNRHRYETTYRERNLKGFYPGAAHPVQIQAKDKTVEVPGFSLITEDRDGQRYKRTYAYEGYRVRMIQKTPWEPPAEHSPEKVLTSSNSPAQPAWHSRFLQKISGFLRR